MPAWLQGRPTVRPSRTLGEGQCIFTKYPAMPVGSLQMNLLKMAFAYSLRHSCLPASADPRLRPVCGRRSILLSQPRTTQFSCSCPLSRLLLKKQGSHRYWWPFLSSCVSLSSLSQPHSAASTASAHCDFLPSRQLRSASGTDLFDRARQRFSISGEGRGYSALKPRAEPS